MPLGRFFRAWLFLCQVVLCVSVSVRNGPLAIGCPAVAGQWAASPSVLPGPPSSRSKSARHAESTSANQICRNRENVRKIHLERVIDVSPILECRRRRHGRDERVTVSKAFREIVADSCALSGRGDIGIVVAAADTYSPG